MAEAVQTAYRSAATDIQQKIRRLVEVWRSRIVFEVPIQDAIEARLDDVDKTKPTGKKPLMGGSLFGSSTGSGGLPKELESLAPLQIVLSKANLSNTPTITTANAEYDKLNGADVQLPAPPLHAARLSALLKSLAIAESSVAESVKARNALISELEKLLESNRATLDHDEIILTILQSRRSTTESKRREVEDTIRRTANAESDGMYHHHHHHNNNNGEQPDGYALETEMDRPEYEALTPPPIEALTPPHHPPPLEPEPQPAANTISDSSSSTPTVQHLLASISSSSSSGATTGIPPRPRPQHAGPNGFGGNVSKKRKVGHHHGGGVGGGGGGGGVGGEMLPPGFGLDLDEDVAEMIRQESGG